MAYTYSHLYNLPTTGQCFFTVYGPWRQLNTALLKFTETVLADEKIPVFNYGKHSHNFTYIDDIVDGVVCILDRLAPPNPDRSGVKSDPGRCATSSWDYNIGNSGLVDLMDHIAELEMSIVNKAEMEMLPLHSRDVPDTYVNIDDLVEQLDYKLATPVEQWVGNFGAWYREYVKC